MKAKTFALCLLAALGGCASTSASPPATPWVFVYASDPPAARAFQPGRTVRVFQVTLERPGTPALIALPARDPRTPGFVFIQEGGYFARTPN